MGTQMLEHLLSAYFHEDWVDVGLWESLDRFIAHTTRDQRRDLVAEIRHTLDTHVDEKSLSAQLDQLGSYVYLADEPGGYRGWLEEMARRVDHSLGT